MLDRPGHGEHHVLGGRYQRCQWPTTASWVARRTLPGVPAISRPSGWLAEQQLVEQGEDVVARRVDVHPDLVDDDRLLGRQVPPAEERAQHQLADHLERHADVLGRHLEL